MIANLISNAIKFIRRGELPKITIETTPTDGYVRLSVRDNGVGVSRADQITIFEPFERLHSNQEFPGTAWVSRWSRGAPSGWAVAAA